MNRSTWILLTILMSIALLLPGCAEEEQETTADDVKKETREAIDVTGKYLSEQKDDAVATTKEQYEKLKDRWSSLMETAEAKGDEAKEKLAEYKDDLDVQMDKLDQQIDKMQEAGDEAWTDVRKNTAEALNKAGDLLDRAAESVGGPDADSPDATDEQ